MTPSKDFSNLRPDQQGDLLRSDPEAYANLVSGITAYGIYLLNPDGRIQSWNAGAEKISGISPREALGQPYQILFSRQSQLDRIPEKTLDYVRANQHVHDEQSRQHRRGDEYSAEVTLDSVRRSSGALMGFVEVMQDVTEARQKQNALYRQATRDAMTGIFNRGHFTEMANQEIERARRFAEPLSVVMLDIDHFKKVNDSYGHDVGDQAIIALARCCEAEIRKIDFVGRLGGEEFAILQPRAAKQPALEMANRLRMKIAEIRIPLPSGYRTNVLSYTASLGVATLQPHTEGIQELLKNADNALYQSKKEGRNKVSAWFE